MSETSRSQDLSPRPAALIPTNPANMKPLDMSSSDAVSTSSAPPASALIDPEQLATFIDLGAEVYHEILNDAMPQISELIASIRDAIAANDPAMLNHAAHKACGTLLTFGCTALAQRCQSLESLNPVIPSQAASIHAELESLWSQSLAAIKQWELSVPEFAA